MVASECLRVFYILDSLPNDSLAMVEGKMLQNIMLQHFEGSVFEDGRIATNYIPVRLKISFESAKPFNLVTQVPHQPNADDCGCFAIYFAKKFLADPLATMSIIKVISAISLTELN